MSITVPSSVEQEHPQGASAHHGEQQQQQTQNNDKDGSDSGSSDDEDDGSSSSEDDDDDEEDIAKRLADQLWADISKAQADRAGAPAVQTLNTAVGTTTNGHLSAKENALLMMKQILTFATKDAVVNATLGETAVPELDGQNVLSVFNESVSSGILTKRIARLLHQIVLNLSSSPILFGSSQHHQPTSIGKRKRDEEGSSDIGRTFKRPFNPSSEHNFHTQITNAVQSISSALTSPTTSNSLDSSLISSIQLPLHQIFLFSVTSSARPGPYAHILQEISGLIQVLGVLSGTHIGTSPYVRPHSESSYDIGAAVYPCLIQNCPKTFERLYHLRTHQRTHADHRPHRCTTCPAAFARSHDLKRHAKLHDRKAWKCGSCNKIFSRRDAIKRHMNRSGAVRCEDAEITEVDLEESGEQSRDERLTKIWSSAAITANGLDSSSSIFHQQETEGQREEGELDLLRFSQTQAAVATLHGILKAHVESTSGGGGGNEAQVSDPSYGQAALASVIARAQSQAAALPAASDSGAEHMAGATSPTPLSSSAPNPFGLSDEQARILEQAIVNAAAAAQAQAEAEAAMEEEENDDDDDDDDDEDAEGSDCAG